MAKRGNHSRRGSSGSATAVKIVLLVCVLLVLVAAGSSLFSGRPDVTEPPVYSPTPPATSADAISGTPGGEEPAATPGATPGTSPGARPSRRPNSNIPANTAAGVGANLSVTVPENNSVDDNYFADAVFVGDSRVEGFRRNSGLSVTPQFFCSVGMDVSDALKDAVVPFNGQYTTVVNALRQAEYGKVYLMFGLNELGWVYESVFADYYGQLIDAIRETHPDATIYVQSIIPVSKWKETNDSNNGVYTNANVMRLQKALCDMCEEKQVNYVNVAEVMQDGEGYLYSDATDDGVHLNATYCKKWTEYLKTHTV